MILTFRFIDFKNFKDTMLNLENFNVVIGANASGKSNLVEGIKFFTIRSQGMPPEYAYKEIRGEAEYAQRLNGDEFYIACTAEFDDCHIGCQIENATKDQAFHTINLSSWVDDEGKERTSFTGASAAGELISKKLEYMFSLPGESQVIISRLDFNDQISKLSEHFEFELDHTPKGKEVMFGLFYMHFNNVVFIDCVPKMTRDYVSIKDNQVLRPNGENLSAVLHSICKDDQVKSEILEILRYLPENEISDIAFSETDLGDVMLVLLENYGGNLIKMPARILSDGTLRCLSILTALFSQKAGSLIVVEEFDNGLHPKRASILTRKIYEIANRRDIQVILTTHNTAVLNSLDKDMLTGVNICYRNADGDAEIINLLDIPDYMDLLIQGKLGDLLAEDKITEFIKRPKKRETNIDWLVN